MEESPDSVYPMEDEETSALETETETLLGAITESPPRREAVQRRRLPRNSVRMLTMKGEGAKA